MIEKIENVNELANMIIDYFEFKNVVFEVIKGKHDSYGYGFNMEFDFGKNHQISYRINLCVSEENEYDLTELYPCLHERMFSFLDLTGYENTTENRAILGILHEIGHIDYLNKMLEEDFFDIAMYARDTMHGLTLVSLTTRDISDARESGVDIPYMIRGDEMYADAFAIKYFIPVYRFLSEAGIVK